MAIIKTLLLQDSARLGCHGIVVWALLFAIGCIHYALAIVPQTVTLSLSPTGTAEGSIWIQDAVEVVMTCGNTDSPAPNQYIFKQDGNVVQTGDGAATALTITKFNVSSAGTYLCNARNTDGNKDSAPTIQTLKCITVGNTGCGDHGKCVEERSKKFCKCRYNEAAVFASACHECNAANDGCVDGSNKPRCEAGTCKKCNEAFCKNKQSTPVCDTSSGSDDGKCVPKPVTQASPATGSSGGSTNDDGGATDSKGTTAGKADTTSSAGTVTSTACLVIASVVVALMN